MPSTIEVFSDFVCPYYYLAEQLLADAVEGSEVHISWQSFELRPEPTPTLRPEGDYLESTWVYPMAERMGVPIVLPRVSPQPYGRLAFEGFAYAAEHGVGQRYIRISGCSVRRWTPAATPRRTSRRYAAAHQQALRRARELQITVVPTFLFDGRRLEGMPTAEGLHRLLISAVARR
ncbi:MAG: DsbA family oxidoreductase [Pseudonocardiaceae bacterium]